LESEIIRLKKILAEKNGTTPAKVNNEPASTTSTPEPMEVAD
jgi:hypothetical protein